MTEVYDLETKFATIENNFQNNEIISNVDQVKYNSRNLLEGFSFDDYVRYIQRIRNVTIVVDDNEQEIFISDNENKSEIGRVHYSNFTTEEFFSNKHLYKKIFEPYLGQGFGEILFRLYLKKSLESKNFPLPKKDYTMKASVINLYRKFGYEVTGKIVKSKVFNGKRKKLTKDDLEEIEKNMKLYKSGKKEKEKDLSFIVILKRK